MREPLDRGKVLKLTSEIVVSYISCHRVTTAELEVIIGSVAGSLAEVGARPEPVPVRPTPAVPVRRSLGRDHLVCLVCGKKLKTLKRHLAGLHQLTPDEYRDRFDLKSDHPLVAPSYAALRSEFARRTGLGRKPAAAAPAPTTTASKGSPSQKPRTGGGSTKSRLQRRASGRQPASRRM